MDLTTPAVLAHQQTGVAVTEPAVQARGLRKTYGGTVAVDRLDLEVPVGVVLGLLGPNGAGKTTLIRMLSTVVAPDAGTFTVAGVPDRDPVGIRRRIGVLPESAGHPRGQTAEEWLTYHARLFDLPAPAARDRARELLQEVGLSERARSRIGALSRGMRQRLGIARALVNRPRVAFLDEPTLGLDPQGQRQVLQLIRRIARDHETTVVLSTHVLDDVEQVCDQVLILHRGRAVTQGTVGAVIRQAAGPRRARLSVPREQADRAVQLLRDVDVGAEAGGSRPGELDLTMPAHLSQEDGSGLVLRCLLNGDVAVLGYTAEAGRLSDAFLAMTEEPRHV